MYKHINYCIKIIIIYYELRYMMYMYIYKVIQFTQFMLHIFYFLKHSDNQFDFQYSNFVFAEH